MDKTLKDVGIEASLLNTNDIIVREDWNSRKTLPFYDEEPKKKSKAPVKLSEKDEIEFRSLVESMQARIKDGKTPNHTAINVRRNKKGELLLKSGSRRLAAAKRCYGEKGGPILAIVEEFADDTDVADRIDNLTENLQRANLQPWEIANGVAEIVKRSKKKPAEVSRMIGLAPSYVGNLLRMKEKLSPELWESYKLAGDSMPQRHLLAVCTMPKAKQVDAYNELVKSEKGGRPAGAAAGPGSSKAPPKKAAGAAGTAATADASGLKLGKDEEAVTYVKLVARTKTFKGRMSQHFLDGVAYGLRVANGDFTFDLDAVEATGQYPVGDVTEEADF